MPLRWHSFLIFRTLFCVIPPAATIPVGVGTLTTRRENTSGAHPFTCHPERGRRATESNFCDTRMRQRRIAVSKSASAREASRSGICEGFARRLLSQSNQCLSRRAEGMQPLHRNREAARCAASLRSPSPKGEAFSRVAN